MFYFKERVIDFESLNCLYYRVWKILNGLFEKKLDWWWFLGFRGSKIVFFLEKKNFKVKFIFIGLIGVVFGVVVFWE